MTRVTRYITLLSVIQVAIAACLFVVLTHYGPRTESIAKDVQRIMLEDDGYYKAAGAFAREGKSLLHNTIGPGLPLVYSAIFLFPDQAHPYVRWVLTTLGTMLTFVLVWLIVKPQLTPGEFFIGSLVTIMNPVFIHWSFKSQPDTFVGLLLVLFVYLFLKALESKKHTYFVYAMLAVVASIFVRPSVLFVAPVLVVFGLLLRWKRLSVYALILVVLSYSAYSLNKSLCSGPAVSYASGVTTFVCDAYQVDEIIKQRRVEVHTHNQSEESLAGPGYRAMFRTTEWMTRYGEANPTASSLQAMIDFTRENPGMVLWKCLLNPVFFFALGSREIEFYVSLVVTIVSFFFVIWGIRLAGVDRRMLVILGILLGYVAMFAVIHGLNRYSIAVLPLLYVYAGKSLVRVAASMRKRTLLPNH